MGTGIWCEQIHICSMNKKPIILSFAILLGAFMLTSCGTSGNFRIKSSDYQDINKGTIQQVNKLAEYKVETTKVTGTHDDQSGYNVSTARQSMENAKQFAIANAIEKAKCDFLVNPLYDIEVSGTYIKVTVEGYPASYTAFATTTTPIAVPVDVESRKSLNLPDFGQSK